MIPMPGKIIVKQDGGSEKRGGVLVSQKFAEKDRPMTGRVLAVGPGKRVKLTDADILYRANQVGGYSDTPAGDAMLHAEIAAIVRVALEDECRSLPVCVKAGDRVVFKVFAGDGIEWTDGSMCRCVTEDDLLAIILE